MAATAKELVGHNTSVRSVAFSSDSRWLASGSVCSVRIWNVPSGVFHTKLTEFSHSVVSLAFSPDGLHLLTACDNKVQTWLVSSGAEVASYSYQGSTSKEKADRVLSVAWSADGKLIAAGGDGRQIVIWDIKSGETKRTGKEHSSAVSKIVFSHDSRKLASGGFEGTVVVWDVATGCMVAKLHGNQQVWAMSFSLNDKTLSVAFGDHLVRAFQLDFFGKSLSGKPKKSRFGLIPECCALSFDGSLLATGSGAAGVCLFEVTSTRMFHRFERQRQEGNHRTLAFSNDSKYLVSGGDSLFLWTLPEHLNLDPYKIPEPVVKEKALTKPLPPPPSFINQPMNLPGLSSSSLLPQPQQPQPRLISSQPIPLNSRQQKVNLTSLFDGQLMQTQKEAEWSILDHEMLNSRDSSSRQIVEHSINVTQDQVLINIVNENASPLQVSTKEDYRKANQPTAPALVPAPEPINQPADTTAVLNEPKTSSVLPSDLETESIKSPEHKQNLDPLQQRPSAVLSPQHESIKTELPQLVSPRTAMDIDSHPNGPSETHENTDKSNHREHLDLQPQGTKRKPETPLRHVAIKFFKKDVSFADPSMAAEWTADEVSFYLKQNKIPANVVEILRQEEVAGADLLALTHNDLKLMGVDTFGKRAAIIRAAKPLAQHFHPSAIIQRHELKIHNIVLGTGHFSKIFLAEYKDSLVATKQAKVSDGQKYKDLVSAATMMKSVAPHEFVLRFVGLCVTDEEAFFVTDLCQGSLLERLKDQSQPPLLIKQQITLITNIAKGLNHLIKSGVVHGDIACRNVLYTLSGTQIVPKISNYSGARHAVEGTNYFTRHGNPRAFPWTAPEIFIQHNCDEKSDVFAFGVSCWEIFTHGHQPLNDKHHIPEFIMDATNFPLLAQPDQCPDDIYALINACTAFEAQDRPNFSQVLDLLSQVQIK